MKNQILKCNIENFESMRESLSLQAAIKEANRCLLCSDAPCTQACPAGTDPGKFIRQIKFLNFKGAARTVRNNNILGSVCAFVCPVEKLCEEKCSALALEDPINIGGLQRFAAEYGQQNGVEKFTPSDKTKAKVAIIGAGPAGMSCAAELAKLDYNVTIFEKNAVAGGMPHLTIPEFRLPQNALQYDIQNLLDLGVHIQYNSPIERETQIKKLKEDGFNAIFMSTGLTEAFELPIFKECKNAVSYIEFLSRAKADKKAFNLVDTTVAVIGGGSVGVDSANTAKALSAKKVYLISLEGLSELPADDEEIRLAQLMNIVFKTSSQIVDVEQDNNKITILKGLEIEWKELGNFNPANALTIANTEFKIPIDFVVTAIGTAAGSEIPGLNPNLKIKGKNTIQANDEFCTSVEGVFAGGDVVNGGSTVVKAVGDGKKAAQSIDVYLSK
ncbi:MAG: FAD-dependent oxidoreductase [Salinivirgaceae bacterium]|nr:FAD-dependent oxidoreductase [Salinivirgaceae bacterium]